MLTALTPLVEGARRGRLWFECAARYTLAGLLASAAVGATLGLLGSAAGLALSDEMSIAVIAALAAVVSAREAELVRFPWPQARRMSRGRWARRWGIRKAAVLWGLDIGSFFTTWMTFLGAWWLVAVAVLSGQPLLASALLATHWSGRALVVWLGPTLVPSAMAVPSVSTTWSALHRPFQLLHVCAVLLGTAGLAVSGLPV